MIDPPDVVGGPTNSSLLSVLPGADESCTSVLMLHFSHPTTVKNLKLCFFVLKCKMTKECKIFSTETVAFDIFQTATAHTHRYIK